MAVCFLSGRGAYGQYGIPQAYSYHDFEEPLPDSLRPSFAATFENNGKDATFSQLRVFLDEQDGLKKQLADQVRNIQYRYDQLTGAQPERKRRYLDSILRANPADAAALKEAYNNSTLDFTGDGEDYIDPDSINRAYITAKLAAFRGRAEQYAEVSTQMTRLRHNLSVATADARSAMTVLERKYRLEKAENARLIWVSVVFGVIIAGLLVGFFFVMLYRQQTKLAEVFLSGYGLQFVALFALIICIGMFGVLKIIPGAELATMLGAIAGFILGKGTIDASSKAGQEMIANTGQPQPPAQPPHQQPPLAPPQQQPPLDQTPTSPAAGSDTAPVITPDQRGDADAENHL